MGITGIGLQVRNLEGKVDDAHPKRLTARVRSVGYLAEAGEGDGSRQHWADCSFSKLHRNGSG
jgi:hypothetical protein